MPITDRWIRRVRLALEPPRLGDNRGDLDRLVQGIKRALGAERIQVDLPLMRDMPGRLREGEYKVQALTYSIGGGAWRLMDLSPPEDGGTLWGIAADLGSSTIALRLIDLESGERKDETVLTNPQREIGQDILTRIQHAERAGGLEELQRLAAEGLNSGIQTLARRNGLSSDGIAGMTLAGNTTMTHFLLGLETRWIRREPYIPAANTFETVRATEAGIRIHPEAPLFVLPNVGSYFGGDLIAGILATGMARKQEVSMLVDIGTNAEIVLGNREWLIACAGAAGPALEGGVAEMGMPAGPGAIEKVRIDSSSGQVTVRTIEGGAPVGICGSGLIDLVAQLHLAGMIDGRGKFVAGRPGRFRVENDGSMSFVVVPSRDSGTRKDLVLAQTDIDALLRSKAAMYTILTLMAEMVDVPIQEISTLFLAGTFGTYIDPRSAVSIGMVPDLPPERFKTVGNSSLEGASAALVSQEAREEICRIRDRITYIELNVNQEFMNRFSAARFIPGH
jgi:uncharacterized 2Fe-2S/4Fe-4S cluster protein (DUF4445 family)